MKLVAAHLLFLFLCMNSQPSAVTIDPLNWKEFLLSESSLTGKGAQQQIENKQAAILKKKAAWMLLDFAAQRMIPFVPSYEETSKSKDQGPQAPHAFTSTVAEQSIANFIITLSCSVKSSVLMAVESDYTIGITLPYYWLTNLLPVFQLIRSKKPMAPYTQSVSTL